MSRLLDQRRIDALLQIATQRTDQATDTVRKVMYSTGEKSAPPGFDNIDSPDQVRIFTRFIQRQAEREQRGAVAGNLNQTIAENPSVQQMAMESGDV